MASITDVMNGFTDMIHKKMAELGGTKINPVAIGDYTNPTGDTSPSIAQMGIGTPEIQAPQGALIPGRNAPVSVPPIVNFFQGAAASLNRQARINQGLPPDEPVTSQAVSAPVSSVAPVASPAVTPPSINPRRTAGSPTAPPVAPITSLPIDRNYILSSSDGTTGSGNPDDIPARKTEYAAQNAPYFADQEKSVLASVPKGFTGSIASPFQVPGSDTKSTYQIMNGPDGRHAVEEIRAGGIDEVGRQISDMGRQVDQLRRSGVDLHSKIGQEAVAKIMERVPLSPADRRAKEAEAAFHTASASAKTSMIPWEVAKTQA